MHASFKQRHVRDHYSCCGVHRDLDSFHSESSANQHIDEVLLSQGQARCFIHPGGRVKLPTADLLSYRYQHLLHLCSILRYTPDVMPGRWCPLLTSEATASCANSPVLDCSPDTNNSLVTVLRFKGKKKCGESTSCQHGSRCVCSLHAHRERERYPDNLEEVYYSGDEKRERGIQ